jgi:kynurenine 3-monooxygenase
LLKLKLLIVRNLGRLPLRSRDFDELSFSLMSTIMIERIVIVGAGASGVLLALYLLRRSDRYQIDLYDRLGDPRELKFSNARTYPITLTERGMNAIAQIEGLEAAVREISLETNGTVFHQQNGKKRVTSRKKSLLTLDRTNLVIILLQQLMKTYKHRVNLHFNHVCTNVNFADQSATFQAQTPESSELVDLTLTVNYDRLIGADGARSVVRSQFLNTEMFEIEQKYIPNVYKSIVLPNVDPSSAPYLEADKVHSWRTPDGIVVLLLYQADGSMSGIVYCPRKNTQAIELATPEAVLQFFCERFPEVGQLMPRSEAEAFIKRSVSSTLTIRCNRYHYGDRVLILGDAAHATSPSLGQGCNAALEDVAIFDHLLDEFADDWGKAIAQFTVRRKADAHALVELSDNSLPSSSRLFIEFMIRARVSKMLHHFSPDRFSPSLFELITESSTPYSEILDRYKGWIARVKESNQVLEVQ